MSNNPVAFSSPLAATGWQLLRHRVALFCLLLALFTLSPARAQTNPTPASCGLPTGGTIVQTVTYTLTADCTQTANLIVSESTDLTIVGAGHTINAEALTNVDPVIQLWGFSDLDIGNVTIRGGGRRVRGVINTNGSGTVSISDVTFESFRGSALYLSGERTVTLARVLIQNAFGNFNDLYTTGSAMYVVNDASVTATDLVLRDLYSGNAALSLNLRASLTLNGCLTIERIWPQNTSVKPDAQASLVDNSSGQCTGTIGNGDSAVVSVPTPAVSACGMPLAGIIETSTTYNLNSDCALTGNLWFPVGVDISINGRGHSIRVAGSVGYRLYLAGDFTVRDTRFQGFPSGTMFSGLRSTLSFTNVIFRNNGGPVYIWGNTVTFNNVIFEDHHAQHSSVTASVLAAHIGARVTVQNAVIRRNSNPNSLIWLGSTPTLLTFEGCLTREDNDVDTINPNLGTAVDNSVGPCPETLIVDRRALSAPSESGATEPVAPAHCFQRLGAIGLICYREGGPDPGIEVWGITEDSRGYFLLAVNQRQIDAVPAGHVNGTADGRVAVRVWPDRNVTVLMGPSPEGKVHHVTFESHIYGRIIGTIDTFGGPPGPIAPIVPIASAGDSGVVAQAPRIDGSIVHVVQPSDTVITIAKTYGVHQNDIVERNRLANDGHLIIVGQKLVIRDAA